MRLTHTLPALLATALLFPTAAHAEYGGFIPKGCTKDNVLVQEEILWNCGGACSTTPRKAAILEEANRVLAIYPTVVSQFTRAQVAQGFHVPEILEQASLDASGIRSKLPKFGATCNPAENILIRSFGSQEQ